MKDKRKRRRILTLNSQECENPTSFKIKFHNFDALSIHKTLRLPSQIYSQFYQRESTLAETEPQQQLTRNSEQIKNSMSHGQ
jgi:hypothetical protein